MYLCALQNQKTSRDYARGDFLNPVYQAVVDRTEHKEQRKQQKHAEKHKGAHLQVGGGQEGFGGARGALGEGVRGPRQD